MGFLRGNMEFTSSLVNYNTTINIYSGIVEYYSKDYSSSGWLEPVKHPDDGGNIPSAPGR